jgi:hypothetical protein
MVFRQQGEANTSLVYVISVPRDAQGGVTQSMAQAQARLVSTHGTYDQAMAAARAICAGSGGERPPPPAAPPACPGPSVTAIYDLWNPPPYGGLGGTICRDSGGGMWINVSNNIYPVTAIQIGTHDANTGCWYGTEVVTPHHTYGGNLCKK